MQRHCAGVLLPLAFVVLFAGPLHAAKDDVLLLREAQAPAWSLDATSSEMIVSVSPARQTLQILGSTGAVLGTGISAIANDRHRRAIEEVLQGYDAGTVFAQRLQERLEAARPGIQKVSAMGSTAGYKTVQEAQQARFEGLAKAGHDAVLDLKITYGLFGYEGTLIAKIEALLKKVPGGHTVWKGAYVVSSESILANDRLSDPTNSLAPNFSSPRLAAEDDAISQWTGDGGRELRARFEEAVDGAVGALLSDLGLIEDSNGAYFLARNLMNRKKFDDAAKWYARALALDPENVEAKNGQSVNLAHAKKVDEAIAAAKAIVEARPDYGPALFNLAWWLALDKKEAAAAKPYYTRAIAAGIPPVKKLNKELGMEG
jgi:tetratricopeptide (TPR) repeat protein